MVEQRNVVVKVRNLNKNRNVPHSAPAQINSREGTNAMRFSKFECNGLPFHCLLKLLLFALQTLPQSVLVGGFWFYKFCGSEILLKTNIYFVHVHMFPHAYDKTERKSHRLSWESCRLRNYVVRSRVMLKSLPSDVLNVNDIKFKF